MAIAPSKLGVLIDMNWSDTNAIVRDLRSHQLVDDAEDAALIDAIERARREHESLVNRRWNSPNERARVFLEHLLNAKGREWAVPLKSIDDEARGWRSRSR